MKTAPRHRDAFHEVLAALAARLRDLREQRGWSRAELARRSGLSLRFLARVEAGDGNLSLGRLAELAAALGTTPDVLVRPSEEPVKAIALVGMRGAGKSSVGPILAERLRVPFVEMDDHIRETAGLPLDQIFEMHGERYYRQLELETLDRVLGAGSAVVLAAAGGVVNEPSTWELLRRRATVVWLRARPEDHWSRVVGQGDARPMRNRPDAMAELRARLAARERLYAQAHLSVDTTGRTPAEIAGEIESRIGASGLPRRGPSALR